MKLATKRAGTRGVMRERHRQKRAVTPPLASRFPQYASLRLEFVFVDEGPFTPTPQVAVLHPAAPAFFAFPCPYDDCDGDFDLAPAIDAMAAEKKNRSSGKLRCCGQRTGQKGKFTCELTLEFRVQAEPA